MPLHIALVGDYDPAVTAHQAIPLALAAAGAALGVDVAPAWTATDDIPHAADVADAHGIWCVPASPYRSTDGALHAIRVARERGIPFLGTCGGFQHAIVEYARSVLRWSDAAHAELTPEAATPVIAPLECALVEVEGAVHFARGSRLAAAYGAERAVEGYHCRYGLNPAVRARLEGGPLRVTATDDAGDVRGVELDGHPFFVATLFQPERAALAGALPPVVRAFVAAAVEG